MTLIPHYVSKIFLRDDEVIIVTFQEKVSNNVMKDYLEQAQADWTKQGLPDKIPISTLNQVRNDRFKNEFQMRFPYHLWKQRDLKINDLVSIDMPLVLDDVISVKEELGV